MGVKWPGCEVNHLPSTITEVKNEYSYAYPVCICCLVLDRDMLPLRPFSIYSQIMVNKQ